MRKYIIQAMDNYITKKRYDFLIKEIKRISEVELPAVSKAKLLAAQEGDLRENGGYHAAKERMLLLGAKLDEMGSMTANPTFIEDMSIPGNVVTLGTVVKVQDLKTNEEVVYSILGPADADPDKNIISFQTPIARGMIRKKAGDVCDIATPGGLKKFKILSVKKYSGN